MSDLPPEVEEYLAKIATPAHLAMTCSEQLPEDLKWRPAKHLLYINDIITRSCLSPTKDFIDLEVSMRGGKSHYVSGWLPFWYLGLFPERKIALLSYNEDKAKEWGEFTRELMEMFGPALFGHTVDPGKKSKTIWGLKGHRGEIIATGLSGTIVGKGFDLACIDDPFKNQEEADSPAIRKVRREGYYSNVRSRLTTRATCILACARWREDDLAGDIVHGYSREAQEEAAEEVLEDQWSVIRFPMLAECPDEEDAETWRDEIGRADGDPLWPELWPLDDVLQTRATLLASMPSTWWACYQQNPKPKEGREFKKARWEYTPHVDRSRLRMVRFWDLAASKDAGDWTVGLMLGMAADSTAYVIDVQRFRKDAADVERHIRRVAEEDGIMVPVRIEQEKSGSGKALASVYKRLLVGFDVDAKQPDGQKEARAMAVVAQQQDGRVVLLRAGWNQDLVDECAGFPKGRWDDQVDALSGAFNHLALAGPTVMESDFALSTPLSALYGNSQAPSGGLAVAQRHGQVFGGQTSGRALDSSMFG